MESKNSSLLFLYNLDPQKSKPVKICTVASVCPSQSSFSLLFAFASTVLTFDHALLLPVSSFTLMPPHLFAFYSSPQTNPSAMSSFMNVFPAVSQLQSKSMGRITSVFPSAFVISGSDPSQEHRTKFSLQTLPFRESLFPFYIKLPAPRFTK